MKESIKEFPFKEEYNQIQTRIGYFKTQGKLFKAIENKSVEDIKNNIGEIKSDLSKGKYAVIYTLQQFAGDGVNAKLVINLLLKTNPAIKTQPIGNKYVPIISYFITHFDNPEFENIKILMDCDFDNKAIDKDGFSPLDLVFSKIINKPKSTFELFYKAHKTAMVLLEEGYKIGSNKDKSPEGVKIKLLDGTTESLLMEYCRSSEYYSVEQMKELFSKNISDLERDDEGKSPLHHLCERTTVEPDKINLLRNKHHFVTNQNNNGETPLHTYLKFTNTFRRELKLEVIKLLTTLHSLSLRDNNGKTPIDYIEEYFKENESLASFINAIHPNRESFEKLHIECAKDKPNFSIVRELIQKMLNTKSINEYQTLNEFQFTINQKDKFGKTIIQKICEYRQSQETKDILIYLLHNWAHPRSITVNNIQNEELKTIVNEWLELLKTSENIYNFCIDYREDIPEFNCNFEFSMKHTMKKTKFTNEINQLHIECSKQIPNFDVIKNLVQQLKEKSLLDQINDRDYSEKTILQKIYINNTNPEIILFLIENYADPRTASEFSCNWIRKDVSKMMIEEFKSLIEKSTTEEKYSKSLEKYGSDFEKLSFSINYALSKFSLMDNVVKKISDKKLLIAFSTEFLKKNLPFEYLNERFEFKENKLVVKDLKIPGSDSIIFQTPSSVKQSESLQLENSKPIDGNVSIILSSSSGQANEALESLETFGSVSIIFSPCVNNSNLSGEITDL